MKKRSKPKQYNEQFVREMVNRVGTNKKPLQQFARELGVPRSTLHGWIRRYGSSELRSENSGSKTTELECLRRENRILKMERQLLKTAATLFAAYDEAVKP